MSGVIKGQVTILFCLLAAFVVTLAACGGGSSSTGGGGGGASGSTVAGTVNDGVASVYPAGQDQPVFLALADMLVEPAQAAPVNNVPVILSCPSYNETVNTDPDGRFVFENVPAEVCTLVVDGSDPIQFDVGGQSSAEGQVNGNGTVIHVEITIQAQADTKTVSGEIEDDASSDDDDSSGDGASEDDDSIDDASVDDDSVDDSNDDGDSEDNTA